MTEWWDLQDNESPTALMIHLKLNVGGICTCCLSNLVLLDADIDRVGGNGIWDMI